MTTFRKIIFAENQIYHVFNRGVERRIMFGNKREYQRALDLIDYYRFNNLPYRYSKYSLLRNELRQSVLENLRKSNNKMVDIIAFCLMPNHFHFLLKQLSPNGISQFTANFTNSYTKYFNTRHKRIGSLTQGLFKAVRIESDEQLLHITRYVHLNPVTAYLIDIKHLNSYAWSSYPEYVNKITNSISTPGEILNFFSSRQQYIHFVEDQVNYSRELDKIKHLILE